ncbi:MAG: SDR family oxidoreductase [Streptosporangiales bacterium]|nr:SDR family oxidoreductase [Streptosporangiales bacterium]
MSTLVVTGGAKGIGRGVAEAYANDGWSVVIADADAGAAAATAAELGTAHIVVDVTDRAALVAAFAEVAAGNGGIDALVTCAGITRVGPSAEQSAADWEAVIGIDLTGTFYSCQAAFPHLGDGGAIVTVASIAAFRGMAERAAYCAAKAGVVAVTRTLATEWARHGIRVNSVAPGWVDTPFLRDAAAKGYVDLDELAKRPPMGRIATVAEIVGSVRFLLSGDAGLVTGQTLAVDGGWVNAG